MKLRDMEGESVSYTLMRCKRLGRNQIIYQKKKKKKNNLPEISVSLTLDLQLRKIGS